MTDDTTIEGRDETEDWGDDYLARQTRDLIAMAPAPALPPIPVPALPAIDDEYYPFADLVPDVERTRAMNAAHEAEVNAAIEAKWVADLDALLAEKMALLREHHHRGVRAEGGA